MAHKRVNPAVPHGSPRASAHRPGLWVGREENPYGYAGFVGLKTRDPMALRERVEEGLSYAALVRLQETLAIPVLELARLVSIPARTLTRRKHEGRLLPEESDRLLRAARIFSLALQLFEGKAEAARRWLSEPQVGLAGSRPFDFVRTEFGAREVERLIGRLEQGVLA
jgi:putative toxin-antitoxin system antitoxin component (TIGR02293 family)